MKSRTILQDKGFLISEVMIAFSLMTIFLVSAVTLSATTQGLQTTAIRKLERLLWVSDNIASTTLFSAQSYGNDTTELTLDPITSVVSDHESAWGRETCDPRLHIDEEKINLYKEKIDIGLGNSSTDVEARNGIIYLTADSGAAALDDFYIIDARDPDSVTIISSLNTGPGLSALEVAGPYVYAANLGTTNQLQVIDISNRSDPIVISKFKLPLPEASTTAPYATAIFYSKGIIYIGTEKWDGAEFAVIDVTDPSSPQYLGGFETNTQVNDIYVRDGKAYVAASDIGQMRVLDVNDPENIYEILQFSPSGWETQIGRTLSYFEGALQLGRTTGGFNVTGNHELFAFSTSSSQMTSRDVPGGIYGIVSRPENVLLATRFIDREFQVWDPTLSYQLSDFSLGFFPQAVSCDRKNIVFATGDRWGIAVLTTD